jgi:hypothetical protein
MQETLLGCLRGMVGTRRLELPTSTVSIRDLLYFEQLSLTA